MDSQANISRLCRLIDGSLRPYTELVRGSLSLEVVKDVMISLSQVHRRIQDWTLEFDSDSDDEMARKHADDSECSLVLDSHPNGHQCMAKIVEHLVSFIGLENQYIQHLAGNTLVSISEFLIASEAGWNELIHLLCHCLKISIQSTLSSSVGHTITEAKYLNFDSLDSILSLKLKLEKTNYITVAAIIRVLRNILKLLKLKLNNKILEVYLDYISNAISNFPWDLLNEAYDALNSKDPAGSGGDVLLHRDASQLKSIAIFHGYLLQLFCSLVGISGLNETETVSYNHRAIYEIRSCIPKMLSGCIGKSENLDNVHISKYLRHKILMLMMRLSFAIDLEHSVLVSWMLLINKHFQDLLSKPIEVLESDQVDCLEGSPFWTDALDAEKQGISSSHLQRLAILLFLRCSLTLVSMKGKPDKELTLASSDSCLTFDLNLKSSSRCEGLLELQKWLQRHLPGDIFMDDETYSASCMSFSSSFLQLYMHEDDILFEMLLQMFCVMFYSRQRAARGGNSSAAKNDIICLISDIFNPIHLFHLFLAEIHYDHQVLLDYLISRDTGDRCAEYLLRCLRLVCDSWSLFLEFSACGQSPNPLPPKRRRVLADGIDPEAGFPNASLKDDLIPSPLEMECKKGLRTGRKHGRTERISFEDAKDCLLSLKASIDSLHQKNLFPYNPQVLLRRLTRFQELCLKQMDVLFGSQGRDPF